jgi:energy-coupling factor transporter transmembrane protein EcfT
LDFLERGRLMQHRKLLILSIVSSVLVILYEFFQWRIIDIVTEFLIGPIWLIVFGFFIVITVRAVIHLFKNKNWKPVSIQVVTILLLFFFPFTEIVLDIDFKINKSKREKVTQMVEDGTLKPNVSYNSSLILLPEKYQQLSKGGGEIVVEKTDKGYYVLFFTYRGILDNFSGFVYSPNGQRPSNNTFDGDFKQIEKLEGNWYWVGSY